jgi:hypothetical protein
MQYRGQLSGRLFAAFITLCFVVGFTGVTQAQIVLTAEGQRLFAEQLLPKVIRALGGSHAG